MEKIKDAKLILDTIGNTYSNIFNFFKTLFTDPIQLVQSFKSIASGPILVILACLIILRFLGFKNIDKWMALTLVIAVLIACI